MTYEEWLNIIESLKNTNTNQEILKRLQNEPQNTNISDILRPKLEKLITDRFELSVNKIVKEIEFIFSDVNYLDLALLNFKKEINYLLELIRIQQVPIDIQVNKTKEIKEDTKKVYEILIKEADKYDYTGVFSLTIKNNMIKWSE
jgi:hypothetical protein